MRKIAIRPNRSDSVPKMICATWPMKKNTMICPVVVDSGSSPKYFRTSANTGSMMSMPNAVRIIVQAESAINSDDFIFIDRRTVVRVLTSFNIL